MLCIGYGEAKAGEGLRPLVLWRPLTRLEFAALILATLSHKGSDNFSHLSFSYYISMAWAATKFEIYARLHIGSKMGAIASSTAGKA